MTESLVTRIRIQQQPTAARIRLQRNEPPIRLRALPQLLPLQVSMRATATTIQYQIGVNGPWIDIIALSAFIPTYATDIETGVGPFSISATTAVFVLNKPSPSATTLNLPAVASRQKLPLSIVDFKGNAGDITVNAAAGETIMGLGSVTLSGMSDLGLGQRLNLFPSTDLAGWLEL